MKTRPIIQLRLVSLLASTGLLTLLATGCRLGQPGSAGFASVVIKNHTAEEIQTAAVQVFQDDGYTSALTGPGQLRFEKEGTRGNDLAYNGLVDTHYGARTVVRVEAEIIELSGGSRRLQCQAYMVRNAGDSFSEDPTRLTNFRSGPYQNLLDKVADRLK
jgi:hypothetical protein